MWSLVQLVPILLRGINGLSLVEWAVDCLHAKKRPRSRVSRFNPKFDNRLSDLLSRVRAVLLNVSDRLFELVGRLGCPTNEPHPRNNRSIRLTTSSCSTSSPRSACSMPLCTPAMKRAWLSSIRTTVSFTNCSASLPLAEATCWSRSSTSVEKCTSILRFSHAETLRTQSLSPRTLRLCVNRFTSRR